MYRRGLLLAARSRSRRLLAAGGDVVRDTLLQRRSHQGTKTKDNKSFRQSVTPKSRTSAEEQNVGQGGRHGSQM